MTLSTTLPAFAGPFHDCNTNPTALSDEVHDDHGASSCSNTYTDPSGVVHVVAGEECTSGCYGSFCPAGEWEGNLSCSGTATNYGCTLSGNIVCGPSKVPRTYSLALFTTDATTLDVEQTKFGFSVGGTSCDCNTPESTWMSNCGG